MTKCDECTIGRDGFVPSLIKKNPTYLFVGEAPGAEEVAQGQPFVGKAGKIIKAIIQQIGIDLEDTAWTNACSCRPAGNRTPTAKETRLCYPRLEQEIIDMNPKVIICLGSVPSRVLIPGFRSIAASRGAISKASTGHSVISTYHPAASLYSGGDKIIPHIVADIRTAVDHVLGVERKYSDPETQVLIIDTMDKFAMLQRTLDNLPKGTLIAVDWETTGLRAGRDVGICMGMSWIPGKAVAIPMDTVRQYLPYLRSIMDKDKTKFEFLGYNAMFDLAFFNVLRINIQFAHDSMLLHYCLDERTQRRSLEALTVSILQAPRYEAEMLSKYDTSKADMFKKVPLDVIMEYCAKDCDWTLRLFLALQDEVKKQRLDLQPYDLLIKAIPAYRAIQDHGMWVDVGYLAELDTTYRRMIEECETKLKEITGDPEFNPRSHIQVQETLWDDLLLQQPKLKKRKDRSANKATRDALLKKYPNQEFVTALDQYSRAYSYYSRYIRSIPDWIDMGDNRVRPNYHFDRTVTGRLSATNPGIQQIPRDSDIRGMYGAPPGRVLVQADYSQLELRMAAHVAKDKNLTSVVNQTDVDFHKLMASMAFKVPVEQVTPDQRQKSKVFTFGVLYFMGVSSLAQQSGLSYKEAEKVSNNYWDMMPEVRAWTQTIRQQILKQHYVESIFKRRRRFALITRENFEGLFREAVNMPIQSASSDLTLNSVMLLYRVFDDLYPEAHIVATVHDSIIVECPQEIADEIAALMQGVMEYPPFDTKVRFPVEIKIGSRWGEGEIFAKKLQV